jgi:hypothetical protein
MEPEHPAELLTVTYKVLHSLVVAHDVHLRISQVEE